MKEKNNNGKEILKLLQENYELNTAQDLSSAIVDFTMSYNFILLIFLLSMYLIKFNDENNKPIV